MSRLKPVHGEDVQKLIDTILKQPVSTALDEIFIWMQIAAAPKEQQIPQLVSVALQHQKLSQTISNWSDNERQRYVTVDPMRRPVWWTHPVTQDQMILIPAGRCLLGEDSMSVHVPGFSMARFPVTNRQFRQFMDETAYQPHDDQSRGGFLQHWAGGHPPVKLLDHPVTWINVADARAYCYWANAQLPTTIQWEKSARGHDGRRFPWGNTRRPGQYEFKLSGHRPPRPTGEFPQDSSPRQSTDPVGSRDSLRSPYGCEDLSGNVSQWCIPTEIPQYPAERKHQFPIRGACFYRVSDTAIESTHERWLHAQRRNQWVGLRICL